ncbi:MAG: acyl-CoA dehydrogenase [Myxococcales bacterium]|nr:acyl-CoA dehydrogenase [Myxococcales bacterium]
MPETTYSVDLRDIRFVLYEYLGLERLQALGYSAVDREAIDLMLEECFKVNRDLLAPLNQVGDRVGLRFEDGKVITPEGFKKAYDAFVQGGWMRITEPEEAGGMGLPYCMALAPTEMNVGANCSLALSIGLTYAAASTIRAHGAPWMIDTYCEKMVSGQWQGTMCLTEPAVGTALPDMKTNARKVGDEWYLRGTKIFITGGEHDLTENHVHLVLSRTEGAPAGYKGLSLFIVPKFRPDKSGNPGEPNDVVCAGIEHKMGIKASPTCVMQFGENDDCRAWLIGEEGQGLPQMFHMMNHARIGVGMQGLAIASQAYQYARDYARERVQGTDIEKIKDNDAPRVTINQHPDVRRMLLSSKAIVEGSRALLYKTANFLDLAAGGDDNAETYRGVVELLTPICKAWVSDRGFDVTRDAVQIMGGYGYVSEYPVEQHLRDAKIASIYEGTNGVQALDLLGRKLPAKGGMHLQMLLKQIDDFLGNQKGHPGLAKDIAFFADEFERWKGVTMKLAALGMGGDRRYPVLCATPYLEMAGNTVVGWCLLEQAVVAFDKLQSTYSARGAADEAARAALHDKDSEAAYYFNKIETTRFFVYNILTRNRGIAAQIESGDRSALAYMA